MEWMKKERKVKRNWCKEKKIIKAPGDDKQNGGSKLQKYKTKIEKKSRKNKFLVAPRNEKNGKVGNEKEKTKKQTTYKY